MTTMATAPTKGSREPVLRMEPGGSPVEIINAENNPRLVIVKAPERCVMWFMNPEVFGKAFEILLPNTWTLLDGSGSEARTEYIVFTEEQMATGLNSELCYRSGTPIPPRG